MMRELVRERKAAGRRFYQAVRLEEYSRRRPDYSNEGEAEGVCGEARSMGFRTIVHEHSAESAKVAALAGCTSIGLRAYVTEKFFI